MSNNLTAQILVVDDEPVLRKVVVASLTAAGHQVEAASSGEEAVALADLWRPALVVLDVEMPGMDGLDACHRIRASRDHKPAILFITGRGDPRTLRRAAAAGAEDLLPKPFGAAELLQRVDSLLAARSLATEIVAPACSLVTRLTKTDARELVNDVVARANAHLRRRGNRLRVTWDSRVDWIWVDGDLLGRVLENLIEDACDCSPPGVPILVEVDQGLGAIDFRVRARGWAIPQELKFCERAVRAHGGRLWIESDGPGASCFHVAIPICVPLGGEAVALLPAMS
jgi:CheY-like chemotaxis protein